MPADEILDGKGCAVLPFSSSSSSMMATTAAQANATSTVAPFCYPIAGFMMAYYYDYRNNDDDNGGITPLTVSSASATGEGGGGAAATTTDAIIKAAMRDIVGCRIISMTVGGGGAGGHHHGVGHEDGENSRHTIGTQCVLRRLGCGHCLMMVGGLLSMRVHYAALECHITNIER